MTKLIRWLSIAFAFNVLAHSQGQAATVSAATCSSRDVQIAIDSARGADTVVIPAGNCAWTSGVTVSGKGIHLTGVSAGAVTITHNAGSANLLTINESTTNRVEISRLHLAAGTGSGHGILVSFTTGGKAVLIHDNAWTGNLNAIRMQTNRGVIWSNTFTGTGSTTEALQCKPGALTSSWTTRSTMGTDDTTGESNVYFENNTVTKNLTEALDPDDNCRIVIRYNTFDNSGLGSHGQDTSAQGVRHWEVYNNTFIFTNYGDCDGSRTLNINYWFFVRGGTGVIADNVMPDISSCAWGTKAKMNITVMNLRRKAGPNACWSRGYPAPRQVGQSHNGSSYITDPVYIWGTTGGSGNPSFTDYVPNECGASAPSTTQFLQAGRDYVVGTPKPGYTKYRYPHPLTLTPPPSPSNLQVR